MKQAAVFFFLLLSTNLFAQHNRHRIDSLQNIVKGAHNDTTIVDAYGYLADAYYTLSPDTFFMYCKKGIALSTRTNQKKELEDFYFKMSSMLTDTGNYAGALKYAEQGLAIASELQSRIKLAEAYAGIGRVYDFQSDFVKSSDYFFKAMAVAQELNDHARIAGIGTNLTAAYYNQSNFAKAQQYALITLHEAQLAHMPVHIYKAYYLLGAIKTGEQDTAAAELNFDSAIAICRQNNMPLAEAEVETDLAAIQKSATKSLEMLLRVRKIYDQLSPASFDSRINLGELGKVYLRLYENNHQKPDYLAEAEKSFGIFLAQSRSTNDVASVAQGLEKLAQVAALKGNYKLAYDYSNQYHAINDSLFSQDNKNKIAALESRNEINKKNQEVEDQKLLVTAQKRNTLLVFAGLVVTGVFGFLFYRLSAIRKHQNKALAQLNVKLDNANKLKAKFFAILTHDLRSPVARLVSFLQLQKRNAHALNEQQRAEQEKRITSSATSLLETMEEILLWSKGQMENFQPEKMKIAVAELFTNLKDFFSTVPGIAFYFEVADGLQVYTDENYLKAIMHNLTQNAVKALQQTENAVITWKAWQNKDYILLSVNNNGPSVSQDQVSALYDDKASIGSKYGLGFHIIRDMAKAIDCTITLNTSITQGTEFVLQIPTVNAPANAAGSPTF